MCDYFCNFVRSGDPNGTDLGGAALPRWEPWEDEKPCTMEFRPEGAAPSGAQPPAFESFLTETIMDRIRSTR
jgi:para-nitrobenzyl esterase